MKKISRGDYLKLYEKWRDRKKSGQKCFLLWRKLDNVATIYPCMVKNDNKNIFRVGAVLKETVDKALLQEALEITLDQNEFFKVKLEKGFFWYYFEKNDRKPLIVEESYQPQENNIKHYSDNQDFLFRVTYYGNRINLEVFHAITDGTGASHFLNCLLDQYFFLQGMENKPRSEELLFKEIQTEDSYKKRYHKRKTKLQSAKLSPAYRLKGKKLLKGFYNIFEIRLNIKHLKEVCKRKEVTATQYLVAHIIQAILEQDKSLNKNNKIRICIPVNMRRYLESNTPANFFSYFFVEIDRNKNYAHFDDLLLEVKREFDLKLQKELLVSQVSSQVRLQKNLLVRLLPLWWKNKIILTASKLAFRSSTMIVSNLGQITVNDSYRHQLQEFQFTLDVHEQEPIKCGICSCGEDMLINFSSILIDKNLQQLFVSNLKKEGIDCTVQEEYEKNESFKIVQIKNKSFGMKLNKLLLGSIVLLITVGSHLDPTKIVSSISVPSSISILLIAQLIIMQLVEHKWGYYITSQIFLSVLGVIPFINSTIGNETLLLPSFICFIIAGISCLLLFKYKTFIRPKVYI